MTRVVELSPDPESVVGTVYEQPDYRDRFALSVPEDQYLTVDSVVTDWFTKQPAMIRLISTNSLSLDGINKATRGGGYTVGSAIGSWEVLARNDNEVVFGDNMGFMEYRFSLRLAEGNRQIEGSTSVRYLWPRAGRFYFALVRPMHRAFVTYGLAKTAS